MGLFIAHLRGKDHTGKVGFQSEGAKDPGQLGEIIGEEIMGIPQGGAGFQRRKGILVEGVMLRRADPSAKFGVERSILRGSEALCGVKGVTFRKESIPPGRTGAVGIDLLGMVPGAGRLQKSACLFGGKVLPGGRKGAESSNTFSTSRL